MEETLTNKILEVSPPFGLLLALNFLLMFARRCPCIPNWMIPWLAFIAGGIVYPMISDPSSVSFAVRYPVAAQSITGLLIGGAAVGSNQLFKQTLKRFGLSTGDTEWTVKPKEKAFPRIDQSQEEECQKP